MLFWGLWRGSTGAVLEPFGDLLWVVLRRLGAFLEVSGAIWWRFLAKMGLRWMQDKPRWQQVAPKMGHDSAKMAMLGSVWEFFGGLPGTIFGHLFYDLWENGRRVKTTNTPALFL